MLWYSVSPGLLKVVCIEAEVKGFSMSCISNGLKSLPQRYILHSVAPPLSLSNLMSLILLHNIESFSARCHSVTVIIG